MKHRIILSFFLIFSSLTLSAQKNALNFDGTNDFVSTIVPAIAGNTAKTIEAWIRTTVNSNPPSSGGSGQKTIVDMGTFVNGQRFTFNLLWNNAIRLEVGGNGLSDTTAVNDGLWHHVACVYDPALTTNQVKLFVDGVLRSQGNLTVGVNTGSSVNVTIGRRVDNVNYFQGDIDEVRVWNVARSVTDIAAYYNMELCSPYPTGLYAYFRLNQGIAAGTNTGLTTVYNQLGNGNGTLNNMALTGATSNWVAGQNLPGSSYSSMNISQCNPYTTASGQVISTSGMYFDTFQNSIGCDSVITYDVIIGSTQGSLIVSQCGNFTTPSGNILTSTGTYTDTITNAAGCDSIITISFVKLSGGSSNQTIIVCDSFVSPAGKVYTATGNYTDTLTTSAGCDSLILTDLTILASSSSTYTINHCGSSYTDPMGNTFTSSGHYDYYYTNSLGCDSTATMILNLTTIDISTTNSSGVLTAAQGGASYQWLSCPLDTIIPGANGQTFKPTVNGNYRVAINLNGCMDTSYCESVNQTSIHNLPTETIEVYPNPARDILKVTSNSPIEKIHIVNPLGQMLKIYEIGTLKTELPIADLQPGIYYLHIITSDGYRKIPLLKD